jgi:uncharacterized protein (TIGR02594 family)
MADFISTRAAFLFKAPDTKSDHWGVVPEGTIFQGSLAEAGFIKTRIEKVSPNEGYVHPLAAQEAVLSPEPIAPDELGVFCTLVTRAARDAGADRDYLMAVAYCGTENLTKLGNAGGNRVGPFQFTEPEWSSAITTGPGKDRQFLPEDRFRWNSQPEVAALLAAECATQLKADTALGRAPTFAELYFAQLFGPGADNILKRPRTDPCPPPAAGTYAAELALASGGLSIGDVLTALQKRLEAGYVEALKVIDDQPPEIRIFRLEDQADPPWLAVARHEMARGVSETAGGRNTEEIKEYFKVTDFTGQVDTTAWCGAFATFCMKKSGIEEVENSVKTPDSALAAWWRGWGQPAEDPHRIGTVIVLNANEHRSGHVGFLVGESEGKVRLLAGNQGGHGGPDHVGEVPFDVGEVVERRWLVVPPMGKAIGGIDARSLHQKGVKIEDGDELFVQNAPSIMRDLISDFPGLTKVHAAAILGNIGQECGGFSLFHQKGMPEGQGGYGWCQWDGERRTAFFKFADDNGFGRQSHEANYGFLKHELTQTSEKQVLPAIKREITLEGAVKTFNDIFERSGKPMMNRRIRYAQLALEAYENSPERIV